MTPKFFQMHPQRKLSERNTGFTSSYFPNTSNMFEDCTLQMRRIEDGFWTYQIWMGRIIMTIIITTQKYKQMISYINFFLIFEMIVIQSILRLEFNVKGQNDFKKKKNQLIRIWC